MNMSLTLNDQILKCSRGFAFYPKPNTTFLEVFECGMLWGSTHSDVTSVIKDAYQFEPPFYNANNSSLPADNEEYTSCNSDIQLRKITDINATDVWKCGVVYGASFSRASSGCSSPIKPSLMIYFILCIAFVLQ